MKLLAYLTALFLVVASPSVQAWTLTHEDGPKVSGVKQRMVVLFDGTTQTLLWSPTLEADKPGRVTILFAIPTPPSKVERLPETAVLDFEKLAQVSWVSAAKKRSDEPKEVETGAVIASKDLKISVLTAQGEAAGGALEKLLGDLTLDGPSAKALGIYLKANWTFAAVSWDCIPGVQTLAPLRFDFTSPAAIMPLKAMSDLGNAWVFVVDSTQLPHDVERDLERAGFEVALDRREIGPNPKQSAWISGLTSFYANTLPAGPKDLFLERFSAQRGFLSTLIVEDPAKAAQKWKMEPYVGPRGQTLEAPTIEVTIPEPQQSAPDSDVGAPEPSSALEEPLVPESVSEALSDAAELDWTVILGAMGLMFFLTVVAVVQIRRRL